MADLFKEDGVLVRYQREARTITDIWQVVVLINRPTQPEAEVLFGGLKRAVAKLPQDYSFEANFWSRRIAVIEHKLSSHKPGENTMHIKHKLHSSSKLHWSLLELLHLGYLVLLQMGSLMQ